MTGIEGFMQAVSVFGDKWVPFALTAATALTFLYFKHRTEAAGVVWSAAGGELLNFLLKILIARPRPSASLVQVFRPLATRSFPSGHVSFYVCFFGFLFFAAYAILPERTLARSLTLAVTSLLILLIGLSRVYLGEHWPSDTLGAYLISGLWLALSVHLYKVWKQRSTFHPEEKKPEARN